MRDDSVAQSLLNWIFTSLGAPLAILLLVSALVCFFLALIVIYRGDGPFAAVFLLLVAHVPILIGVFAALQGAISTYRIIAISNAAPRPAALAEGISTALVAPLVGMGMTIPIYSIILLGALVRGLRASSKASEKAS